ncbi:MAG: pentapeptide repeat-containing protein [Kofleriaceae bacterium]|nr:pentapeptide repeat-containing protein [Kofleriaceae bacterium]MCL4223699.1 pentapeptide repeat-containing protein [Myxococcales bacterium]
MANNSLLDDLAEKRFAGTCWPEIPDWVVLEHVNTLPRFVPLALVVVLPAFLRQLLLEWSPSNRVLDPLLGVLGDELPDHNEPLHALWYLSGRERRFILAILALVARDPAFDAERERAIRAVREWTSLAREQGDGDAESKRPGFTLRRRDFTTIASGLKVPDLVEDIVREVSLAHADLAGQRLTKHHLSGADLRGADLRGAKLRGAVLEGADLTGALLDDTDLRDARLAYACLDSASMHRTRLERAHAPHASFRNAAVREAVFDRAMLESAVFDATGFRHTSMRKAILINALLGHDAMNELDLDGADLRGSTATSAEAVVTPPIPPPVTRGPLLELLGRSSRWIREVGRSSAVGHATGREHLVHEIKLRPDYLVRFTVTGAGRICGLDVHHPREVAEAEIMRWLGGEDVCRHRRSYRTRLSPGRVTFHRHTCSLPLP